MSSFHRKIKELRGITSVFSTIFLFVCILTKSFTELWAQSPVLTNSAEISLITCDPGKELYSVFGHSAVRVHDSLLNIDLVYNYGTFSFNQPNFYLKFARGNLNYMLSVSSFKMFMQEYQEENRSVYEQVLNLDKEDKQNIYNFLVNNYLPENRFYLYDFFFDNCATRIRDIIPKVLNGKVKFDDSIERENMTFRDLIDIYLADSRWPHFAINIALGSKADRIAKANEYMFLPDYLKNAFRNSVILYDGKNKEFAKPVKTSYKSEIQIDDDINIFTPTLVFWSLFVIFLLVTILEYLTKKLYSYGDGLIYTIIGFLGCFILFLWFGTEHSTTKFNWNLIWAMPSHLVAGMFIFRKNKPKFLRHYFHIVGWLNLLILPLWTFIPQRFDTDFIPIILLMSIRGINFYLHENKIIE